MTCCAFITHAQVKIGDNPTSIGSSSALELESPDKALVLTRVASTSSITSPVEGMVVFDLSSNCVKAYEGGHWSACLSKLTDYTLSVNCLGFSGQFQQGVQLPVTVSTGGNTVYNYYAMTITNQTFSAVSVPVAFSDVTLSGASSGITVNGISTSVGGASVGSPSSVSVPASSSLTIYYWLSGTPAQNGALNASWTKSGGLSCTSTTTVNSLGGSVASNYCNSGAISGFYATDFAFNSDNKFVVTITNTSGATMNTVQAPTVSDLALTYTGAGTLTVASASASASGSLAAGASRTYTYVLSGTPTTAGTLTATWTFADLTCTKTQQIAGASANFISNYCNSAAITGSYTTAIAMTSANTFVVTITNNLGIATPVLATPALNNIALSFSGGAAPAMTVASVTASSSGTLAAGASRTFTYTLSGTPTSGGTLTAVWTYYDMTCTKTVTVAPLSTYVASTYCTDATINGFYAPTFAMVGTNTFTVTLTNTSGATINNLTAPVVGNLSLNFSGTASTAFSVASVTTPTTGDLAAGASRTFTYVLAGTPTSTGTLTFNWSYLGLTCTKTKEVTGVSAMVAANYCDSAVFNGSYTSSIAMTASNTFVVTFTNNSGVATPALAAPAIGNLTLSFSGAASPAFAVASVTASSTGALAAGTSRTFTYVLTGTPTAAGTLTANWVYYDMTCTKTVAVTGLSNAVASTYCNDATVNGFYATNFAMASSNTFVVTLTNTSGAPIVNLTAPVTTNLGVAYSGTVSTGFSVASVTASSTGDLAAGASRTFTYVLAGTPTSAGTLTFNWSYLGLTCSKTKAISGVAATTVADYCNSAALNGSYTTSIAMTSANTFTVTFTNNSGVATPTLAAPVVGNLALSYNGTTTTAFTVASVSASSTGALAAGASRTFTYVIAGNASTTGTLTAVWTYYDLTCTKTAAVTGLSSLVATTYCDTASVNGFYASTFAMATSNTFTVTLTNTSGATINNLTAPVVGNLSVSYTGSVSTAFTVASVTATSTGDLAAGATRTFTYVLSGTPTSAGTLSLNWSYLGLTCAKTKLIDGVSANMVTDYCNSGVFNGAYTTSIAMTSANSFAVTFTNNTGVATPTLKAPVVGDLAVSYSGTASNAFSVASVTASTTGSLAAGASRTFTYVLNGTPSGAGTLTASWNYYDLSCSKTKAITGLSGAVASTYCDDATVNGFYASTFAMTSSNTFVMTLVNTSGAAITNLTAPAVANLSLTYTGTTSTVFSVASVTASATGDLAAGASRTFTYVLAGTPSSAGTLNLTWSYLGLSCTKSKAISGVAATVAANYCDSTVFNGSYTTSIAMTSANTFAVTFTNNSGVATPTLAAPVVGNLTLAYSGTASTAFTVASVSASSTGALAAGASRTFTYVLSGTPSTAGTLTATWLYYDLTCTKAVSVTPLASAVSTSFCTDATVNGFYATTFAMASSNTYVVTLTNTSGAVVNNLTAPAVGNLSLSYTGSTTTAFSVASVTASATGDLAIGASRTFTYVLAGTPSTAGTLSLNWSYLGLTCNKTKAIGGASANFDNTYCTNATYNGSYLTTIAMNSANTFVITITNTSGVATPTLATPATSSLVLSYTGTTTTAFSVASVTASSTGALAAGATRTFTYVLNGTAATAGTLSATWTYYDMTCTQTTPVLGTISDLVSSTYCANATVNGFYADSFALSTSNTFAITLTNTSGDVITNLTAPAVGNLSLSYTGTASPPFTVASVTASSTGNLANGASRTFTYVLSGTPTSAGTLNLNWSYLGLNCSKTKVIAGVAATLAPDYCNSTAFGGSYTTSIALTSGNTFAVTITNNSTIATPTLNAPAIGNLALSYTGIASPAFAVSSVTASSTGALAAGASRTFTYVLSGTPSTAGTLTANWTYYDMTCSKTTSVSALSNAVASTYCDNATVNGFYATNFAMATSNTFAVTLTNTSGSVITNLTAPSVANLAVSYTGTASPVFSVASVTASATGDLAAGATRTFTYVLAGTPTTAGTLSLNWSYLGLTCTKTKAISGVSAMLTPNCSTTAFTGAYTTAIAMTSANTFTVTLTNNSGVTTPTLTAPAIGNVVLSYSGTATTAFTVASVTASSAGALAAGASRTFTYALNGTPSSAGTLTAVWTYYDLTCTKTTTVSDLSSYVAPTYCNDIAINGFYATNFSMAATNTFVVTLTNTSGAAITNLTAPATSNLSITTGVGAITVASVTASSSGDLAAGASRTFTYVFSGTPITAGTLNLNWSYLGLTCSKTKAVGGTSANFASNYCTTTAFNGSYITSIAMTSANTFAVTITNTSGVATPSLAAPVIGDVVLGYSGTASTAFTVASVTASTTGVLAAGASRTFTYRINGTASTAGTLTVNWSYYDMNCIKTVTISGLNNSVSSNYCTNANVNGFYATNYAMTSTNTFTVTLTNTSGAIINNLPAPLISNVVLSYTGSMSTAFSVSAVAASSTGDLAAGATRTFTYTIAGTPISSGTLSLNWTYLNLSCSKTKLIDKLSDNFSATYCDGAALNGSYAVSTAMTSSNTFTVTITNTSGVVTPSLTAPLVGSLILNYSGTTSVPFTVASVTSSSTGTLAVGASRTFTYVLSGTPSTAGTLTADWFYYEFTCSKSKEIN